MGVGVGVKVQRAAVYAIINLHLLTGSAWAAGSACGFRTGDWSEEEEEAEGHWVMLG